jgi:hypothetical protein
MLGGAGFTMSREEDAPMRSINDVLDAIAPAGQGWASAITSLTLACVIEYWSGAGSARPGVRSAGIPFE